MGELKSEVTFPKKNRKILGNDDKNYDLVVNYSTALILAELEAKEAKEALSTIKSISGEGYDFATFEDKIKMGIGAELKELIAEPEGSYEDGHNAGIEMCISIIKKLDFTKLLIKGE